MRVAAKGDAQVVLGKDRRTQRRRSATITKLATPLTRLPLKFAAPLVALAAAATLAVGLPTSTSAASFVVCKSGCPFSTIGAAVTAAPAGSTILVLPGTYKETLKLDKSLTIAGLPLFESKTIINGDGHNFVVRVTDGNVSFASLTITGGHTVGEGDGGGLYVDSRTSKISLDDVAVVHNEGDFAAGIINYGTLTLSNSTASENTSASAAGVGGIYNAGTLKLVNSTVNNNKGGNGGGIRNDKGTSTLNDSTVSYNNASVIGGGIDNAGKLTVDNSNIVNNTAGEGGGIYSWNQTVTINSSNVSNNNPDDCAGISC